MVDGHPPQAVPNNSTSLTKPEDEKTFSCDKCDYRCRTANLLSRHINYWHRAESSDTTEVALPLADFEGMLSAIFGNVMNEELPPHIRDKIAEAARFEAQSNLALAGLAVRNIQAILRVSPVMEMLDYRLVEYYTADVILGLRPKELKAVHTFFDKLLRGRTEELRKIVQGKGIGMETFSLKAGMQSMTSGGTIKASELSAQFRLPGNLTPADVEALVHEIVEHGGSDDSSTPDQSDG